MAKNNPSENINAVEIWTAIAGLNKEVRLANKKVKLINENIKVLIINVSTLTQRI